MATDSRQGGLQRWLYSVWYHDAPGGWLLWPLELLFRAVTGLRRLAYRVGIFKQYRIGVPVVIVGNLSVGGSGKTPLVGWLAKQATVLGWHPAIVSRGYGGLEPAEPISVTASTSVEDSGDEALMLARETGLPVFVGRSRVAASRAAMANGANLIIADDGLQHYALARSVEIAVVDAERQHGNGRCLPRGPLRESVARLTTVDLVVKSGSRSDAPSYELCVAAAYNAVTGATRQLVEFAGQRVHAIAGIGHPERFFDALAIAGMTVLPLAPGDHVKVNEETLSPSDDLPVMMTAKDAVKYSNLSDRHWIVPAEVTMTDESREKILSVLPRLNENSS